jgi:hypothetical protein
LRKQTYAIDGDVRHLMTFVADVHDRQVALAGRLE